MQIEITGKLTKKTGERFVQKTSVVFCYLSLFVLKRIDQAKFEKSLMTTKAYLNPLFFSGP